MTRVKILQKVFKITLGLSLFLWTLLFPIGAKAKNQISDWKNPVLVLRKCLSTNDTSQIYQSLKFMNGHFDQFNGSDNLNLLLGISKKERKLSLVSLNELYQLIRKFYPNDKAKNFEYTLKIYTVLSKTNDYEGQTWIMIDLGNFFYQEADYHQAYKFYKRAEAKAEKNKFYGGLSVVNMNLGLVKERLFSFKDASHYYTRCVYYRYITGNFKILAVLYTKIAYCQLKLKNPKRCLYFIKKAEYNYYNQSKMAPEAIDAPYCISLVYAEYFSSKRQYDSSIFYIQKSIDYAAKNQMIIEELIALEYKANYYFDSKQYQKAINSLSKFPEFFKNNRALKFEKGIYEIYHKSYAALKDYKNAAIAVQKCTAIEDSLKKYASNDNLEMMQSVISVYETNFQLNEANRNIRIEKVKNGIKENERNKYLYIAIVSVFLVFLLFGLFLNTQRNKIKMVDIQNRLIEKTNKSKENSMQLSKANQLKNNLFSIISNDLSEPLNRLKVDLIEIKGFMSDKDIISTIESTLDETIQLFEGLLDWSKTEQKDNIFNPSKVSLDININKVISFYINESQLNGITIVNKSIALSIFADQNILQTLLRNALSNAIAALKETSTARLIEIETIVHNNDFIQLLISDSGKGFPVEILKQFNQFDYEINPSRNGLGLSICKVLTKLSNWKIEIANNSKHGGASMSIFIPVYSQLDSNELSVDLVVTPEIKKIFLPLTKFKVYQTSEIRLFLKNLARVGAPSVRSWITEFEKAVHEGDDKYYSSLIDKLL